MLNSIWEFVIENLGTWGVGVLLLIATLVFLPDFIVYPILRCLKRDLASKSAMMRRFRLVLDYVFNIKDVVIADPSVNEDRNVQERIRQLTEEKRLLEGNLFFLDLLTSLTGMLTFSTIHAGYGAEAAGAIIEQSMDYLQYYAQKLTKAPGSQAQEGHVCLMASGFKDTVTDTLAYLAKEQSKEKVEVAKLALQQGVKHFDLSMREEYKSTKEQLAKVNQLLAQAYMDLVEVGL